MILIKDQFLIAKGRPCPSKFEKISKSPLTYKNFKKLLWNLKEKKLYPNLTRFIYTSH